MKTLLLSALAGAASAGQLRQLSSEDLGHSHGGLIRALEFTHKLRVCNAYAYAGALDVFRGDSEKLTSSAMPYKSCNDLQASLKSGDKLEFKVGDAAAGSFAVSDLPENDGILLLVVHRHDAASTSMSFESHVFSNVESAQVAVIDAYKGKERAQPRIKDQKGGKDHRDEQLRFSSVVAVSQGKYDVVLDRQDGSELSKRHMVALQHENYVVLRTGVEGQHGFGDELVVFPQSDPAALPHSGTAQQASPFFAAVLALAAVVTRVVA